MLTKIVIGCIRMYQWLAKPFPRACRFYPSCSVYMIEAIEKYGLVGGIKRGIGRILRCHPGHPGGVDKP
jgi:putative membrane protein insertion efficiency factor